MSAATGDLNASFANGAARDERVSAARARFNARVIVGVATFFAAFDMLAIASVLPVLAPLWKLNSNEVAFLISAGFFGQLVGALFFGWIAESYGRLTAIVWATATFTILSFFCAFAWNYDSLLALRTVQGFGLGGELAVAAVYIAEVARARTRGRFVLLYALTFPVGLVSASLAGLWVVPNLGWQYMFIVGALPAVLALYLPRLLPESPRWLAARGDARAADAAAALIERESEAVTGEPLPGLEKLAVTGGEPASWTDLFGAFYLPRTLVIWLIWFAAYFVNFCLSIWTPMVYTEIFSLPLEVSLRFSLLMQAVGLFGAVMCALAIDIVGRRVWFAISFMATAFILVAISIYPAPTAEQMLAHISAAYFFISTISLGVYLYTPELYPTRARAFGVGAASAWLRIAFIIGPSALAALIGPQLSPADIAKLPMVFLMLAAVAAIAAIVTALFAVETKGRVLEEVSP